MLMERNAEIIRGWPYDGSLERVEPIKSGVTLQNGDWVAKQSDNTIDKSAAAASNSVGLVIVGNGDSSSSAYSGKAVVLWGNFIASISNFAAGSYQPGSPVTVKSGQIALGLAGTDPILGFVLDVVAASSTQTAHITIKVS
jgi:predicted RecA/RadA family phage recombinase